MVKEESFSDMPGDPLSERAMEPIIAAAQAGLRKVIEAGGTRVVARDGVVLILKPGDIGYLANTGLEQSDT